MWLVTGIDEEHRFPDWREAAGFYRQIVGDWVAAHGGSPDGRAVVLDGLRQGGSHEIEFPAGDGSGGRAQFRLAWDPGGGRTDHFVAC
jgi:hypothetical protein